MQKLQYFGHLMWRADSLEKTLILGKVESKRRRGSQRMKWLDSITDSMDMSLSKLRETVDRGAWYAVVHRVAKSQTWLSDWTPTRGTKIPHAQEQKKPCTAKKTQSSQKKHVHIYTGGGGGIPIIIYGLFPLFMNNHCCLLASAFSQTFSCHFNWLTSLIFLMSLNYSFVKSSLFCLVQKVSDTILKLGAEIHFNSVQLITGSLGAYRLSCGGCTEGWER